MTMAHAPAALDEAYREEWRPFDADPGPLVFLIGCQRSGTTWLHLQLARSGAFRYVSAYDVYAGDRLVHNHRHGLTESERRRFDDLLRGAPSDRGIDAIPAGASTPEEYGLLIGEPGIRYDRADTTSATLPLLRDLCAKKALLEGRRLPLLLKSPPDYPGALELLAGTWPAARFVAIQRHPLHTLDSQVRAWRELVLRRNEYLALIDRGYRALFDDAAQRIKLGLFLHSEAGVAWLAESILRAHTAFLDLCGSWTPDRLLTVRYEDLCARHASELARIAAFLGVATPAHEAPAPRPSRISAEVRRVFDARRAAFRPFLEHYGYAAEEA